MRGGLVTDCPTVSLRFGLQLHQPGNLTVDNLPREIAVTGLRYSARRQAAYRLRQERL